MFPDVPHTGLPLSGLRVIDCTIWQQGTYSTAMLADFGADVIKVEGPESPDPGRGFAAAPSEPSAYFESHNRNKRGILIDLKHPEGRETLLRLIETADVFVQNMRQGVMEKLGLGYDVMRQRNPQIIYASASGYGSKGDQAKWPAMDLLGQARGGTMMMQGPPDLAPIFSFGGMADQVGAMMLSYGILLALWHRARTGEGQEVDASLLGGQVALQSFNITSTLFTGKVPARRHRHDADALWNIYECKDGRYIALAMAQGDRWWKPLCTALERLDLVDDPRFCAFRERITNRTELIAEFDRIFAQRDQWDWVNYLTGECALPVAPIQDYGQVVEDPQVRANGYIVPLEHPSGRTLEIVGPAVQLSASPGSIRTAAPDFGEHTEQVLTEAGFSWDEISHLHDAGAIGYR
ncbi:MAG: CoA transferase [Dehalococcoidia bacterium]|nr:CoA transferase [Dehalococcoidia bacterium]